MKFVQDNLWLVLIAIVSGLMFIWPMVAKLFNRSKEVGVAEAVQLINRQDAAVVDVREPGEFKGGHIPNARNIPLGQLAERARDLDKLKGKPVVLACASGNRSMTAAGTLRKAGFAQVVSRSGGMAAWQQAGMPVEKS